MSNDVKRLKNNQLLHKNKTSFNAKYILLYTAAFALVAYFILDDFFLAERTLLRNGDAFFQHYKALMYLAKYIREIITNVLFEHRFVIPQWDFDVGLGSDIITTFAYYSFGDPFNYLSFLVPTKYIHIYYQFMVVFRLYCAGLSFSYMCFKTDKKNVFAVLAGAITYCFSAWAVYSGLKHPYFINPMVFLPLIVLGVEKIIKGKSFLLLTFMVALSTISNFYFFYIIVLLTVIYVAVRLISVYKTDIKAMLRPFINIAGGSALGVGIGAVLFLPVVLAFLGDTRSSSGYSIDMFYPLKSYLDLPLSFLTFVFPSSWLYPCVSVLFVPSVAILFAQKKKNTHIKVLIIASVIMMCFPIFGKIFNGFSYPCNRWCFGYVLVAAYIITSSWERMLNAEKKDVIAVGIGVSLMTAVCLIFDSYYTYEATVPFILFAAIVLMLIVICTKKMKINKVIIQLVLLCFTVISIITYSHYKISVDERNYVAEFSKQKFYENATYVSNEKVLEASKGEKDEFWRFTGRNISQNASFLAGLKSTQYYYSLSNGNISTFRLEMNLPEYSPYCYRGFDSRTVLNELSSVKYFVNTDKTNKSVPYGYKKTDTKYIWENQYALPFGYTYDEYITKEELDSLSSSVDKEWAMLDMVVLENDTQLIEHGTADTSSVDVDYQINCIGENITIDGNKFVVTKKNAEVELLFSPVKNSETLLSFVNMDYNGTNPYDLYSDNTDVDPLGLYSFDQLDEDDKDDIISQKDTWKSEHKVYLNITGQAPNGKTYSNKFYYYTPSASFYIGRKDFDVNLGYKKSGIEKITITFTQIGTYTFDDIKVIAQPMDGYEENVSELKQDTLQNLVIDYNVITGNISLSENKVLCLSMPYADGWSAYVDGEETELLKVNGMYCGLVLTSGEHEIELRYRTPGLKLGAIISLLCIVLFMILLFKECIRKKTITIGKKRKNGV